MKRNGENINYLPKNLKHPKHSVCISINLSYLSNIILILFVTIKLTASIFSRTDSTIRGQKGSRLEDAIKRCFDRNKLRLSGERKKTQDAKKRARYQHQACLVNRINKEEINVSPFSL